MKPLSLETWKGSCKICREPLELRCSLKASVTSMSMYVGIEWSQWTSRRIYDCQRPNVTS